MTRTQKESGVRQRRTRNAGVVDVLWAAGLGGLALAHAALAEGWLPRRVLVIRASNVLKDMINSGPNAMGSDQRSALGAES